jgi:hypothetical protein
MHVFKDANVTESELLELSLQPPLFLMVVALVAGVMLGLTFEFNLKRFVKEQRQHAVRNGSSPSNGNTNVLALPFWGAGVAIAIFFGGCLQTLGISQTFAYGFSGATSVMGTALVWAQLQRYIRRFIGKSD